MNFGDRLQASYLNAKQSCSFLPGMNSFQSGMNPFQSGRYSFQSGRYSFQDRVSHNAGVRTFIQPEAVRIAVLETLKP